jgi:hypothetical protein
LMMNFGIQRVFTFVFRSVDFPLLSIVIFFLNAFSPSKYLKYLSVGTWTPYCQNKR